MLNEEAIEQILGYLTWLRNETLIARAALRACKSSTKRNLLEVRLSRYKKQREQFVRELKLLKKLI